MAHVPAPAIALQASADSSEGDALTGIDDVMAFIDGFFPSPASSDDAFERSLLAGSSSEDSESDLLLSSFLDAAIEVEQTPIMALEMPFIPEVKTEVVVQTPPSAPQTPVSSAPASPADPTSVTNASKRKRRVASDVDDSAAATAAVAAASASTNPPQIKEATRKRNAYREKMKREMQYLRARASEMEEQLAALRQGTVALSDADKQLITSSWKRIAQNQLEAREKAESENERLRRVLQTHMEMSKSLEQSLGKRLDAAFLVEERMPKPKRGRLAKLWEDEGFGELVRDLDDSYDRLGHVMRESNVASATGEMPRVCQMKTNVSPSGVVQPYLELTDASITPFHPRLTARAVWRSLLHDYLNKSTSALGTDNVWHTGNTIAANCRMKHRLKDAQGQDQFIKAKVVMRKYVDEESRMVLVWRAHNDCENGPEGVFVDETGWSVIQPMAGPCGLPDTGSIVRTCMHFVERHTTPTQPDTLIGELANLVVSSNEEELDGLVRTVENILLNEASVGSVPSAM